MKENEMYSIDGNIITIPYITIPRYLINTILKTSSVGKLKSPNANACTLF